MMRLKFKIYTGLALIFITSIALYSFIEPKLSKPVVYIIGDSTVATASPQSIIQGWAGHLIALFDTSKISVKDRAVPGISSRTYLTKAVHDKKMLRNGMWDSILTTLKPGDFVIMQFGHNDDSPLNDTARSRGSIKGIGNDSLKMFNKFLQREEVVHSYGYYIKKFIQDTRSKGATPVLCSPVPMNHWSDNGKVIRNNNTYGLWLSQIAKQTNTAYIDLNQLIADKYDQQGKDSVTRKYFTTDNVHTTADGAKLSAMCLAMKLKETKKLGLKKFLK